MTTKLAGYIKQERVRQGFNYAELSRKMGYENFSFIKVGESKYLRSEK